MKKYLLDSNILIDHLNGITKAKEWFKTIAQDELAISPITRSEVLTGTEEIDSVSHWLDYYDCIPFNNITGDVAAEIRKMWKCKLADAFQAALALQYDLTLITRDADIFRKISSNLKIEIPYALS